MATSSRDVKMTLSVETLGTEDIKRLQDSVAALAKQGGAAAPEFALLAEHIGELANQSEALNAFSALADQTEQLAANQKAAAAEADQYGQRLKDAAAATAAAVQTQKEIADALGGTRGALRATSTELALLNATTDAAGKKEAEYAQQATALKTAKIDQKVEVDRLTAALAESNAAVKEAEAAEARLEGAYKRAAAAAAAADTAVTAQQTSLREAGAAAAALGVSTENIAASQARLVQSLNDAGQAARTAQAEVDRLAAAEQALAEQAAFEKLADDAKRLVTISSYADLFAEAEQRAAAAAEELSNAVAAQNWQREAEAIVNAAEATQELARQQAIQLEVQKALASDAALAKQADEAERIARQAAQVRLFTQVLDELDEKERQAAAAAEEAGNRINNAFSALGVRSAEQLTAEIQRIREAMVVLATNADNTGNQLSGAFARGEAKIQELEREIRELNGTLTLGDQAAKLFSNSLGQIAAGNIIADAVGYLVNKVKELGREFITANVQAETLRRGLTAIYGSAQTAASQIDFLRATANAAGVSVAGITDSFTRFSAASKGANIPLQQSNELFEAVTRAAATLGLSGERVTLVLDALGQMASKGTVTMEELRQQLGDSLPGALGLAAKGLGITSAQLIQLVSNGQLATRDFFPALSSALKQMTGDTDTLQTNWERLGNVMNTVATTAGDSGWIDVLKGGLTALKAAVAVVVLPLQAFFEVLFGAAKAAGVLAGALVTLTNPMQALRGIVDDAAARQQKLSDAFHAGTAAATDQVKAQAAQGVQTAQTTSALGEAILKQQGLTTAVGATGNAYVQTLAKNVQNAQAVEANVLASEKLVKAKQDEGKALVSTAQLTGSAQKALEAQAEAAAGNAAASERLVQARQREVDTTQTLINAINGQRDAQGNLAPEYEIQLNNANKLMTTQAASLEQAKQQTAELKNNALAAQTASDAYADNSTKLAAFKAAMEDSRGTVVLLTAQIARQQGEVAALGDAYKNGTVSLADYEAAKANLKVLQDQLTDSTGAAARNENLYRDAVADSVSATQRKAQASEAALQVQLATVNAQKLHFETLAKEAQALGDVTLATEFQIDAKQKEIQAIELSTRIKNLELDADRAAIEIQEAALDPQDKLYQQKKAELDIRLEIIKAKQIEANASAEIIKGINDEIDAIRRRAAAQRAPLGIIGNPGDQSGGNGGAPPAAAAPAPNGDQQPPRSGPGGAAAQVPRSNQATNLVPTDKAWAVKTNGGAGMSLQDLQAAYQQALNAKQWIDNMIRAGGGADVSAEAVSSTRALVTATKNALDNATAAAGVAARKQAQPASTTHTVNISIGGGRTQSVQVAGPNDADTLVKVLQSLENGKTTAS